MPQLHVASSSLKQKSNGEEHVKAFSHWLGALAAVVGCTLPAQAQNYPTHPITLTIGFPAGGPSDITARIMAEHMGPTLGQPVVVEPVTGASGTIASAKVARAAPDGYSIVLGNWTSHVGAPALYPLAYDTFNDFTPVAPLTRTYLWIIGRNTLPANNVKELVAWLKANPGKATAGTVGVGSAAHLCLLDFANKTGTKFQYIPYRGGAPVMQDVLGGQIDIACIEVSQTLPLVRSGKIKAFGVVADKRSPAAPEIPTPFLVKVRVFIASSTRRPLIRSRTRRAFCGETRTYFAELLNSMFVSLRLRRRRCRRCRNDGSRASNHAGRSGGNFGGGLHRVSLELAGEAELARDGPSPSQ